MNRNMLWIIGGGGLLAYFLYASSRKQAEGAQPARPQGLVPPANGGTPATPPAPALPERVEPTVTPQGQVVVERTTAAGERSRYVRPPSDPVVEARVKDIQETLEARRTPPPPPPQQDANGRPVRTQTRKGCAELLQEGNIDAAERAGCDDEICEQYLQLIEENNRMIAARQAELDHVAASPDRRTTPSGSKWSPQYTRLKQSQLDRLKEGTRSLRPMLTRFCPK